MKLSLSSLAPGSAAYLLNSGEYYQLEAKRDVIKNAHANVEVWGRATVSGERRVFFNGQNNWDDPELRLALIDLALGPLKGDYFVFLNDQGEQVHTCFTPFANPGPRRFFHFSLYKAFCNSEMTNFSGDIRELSKFGLASMVSAAGQKKLLLTSAGMQELDDLRTIAARPQEVFTLRAVATIVGLCLGASVVCSAPTQVTCSDYPVFEFDLEVGKLQVAAGRLALGAFLDPFWAEALSGATRAIADMLVNPQSFPASPYYSWIKWADEANHSQEFEIPAEHEDSGAAEADRYLEQAVSAGRSRRGSTLANQAGANDSAMNLVWWCSNCQKHYVLSKPLVDSGSFDLFGSWMAVREAVASTSAGVPCDCERLLDQSQLQYVGLYKYWPWPGVDIGLELGRISDGRLVEAWTSVEVSGGANYEPYQVKVLPGEPSLAVLWQRFKRYDSPLNQLRRAIQADSPADSLGLAGIGGCTYILCSQQPIEQPWYNDESTNKRYRLYGLCQHGSSLSLLPASADSLASKQGHCYLAVEWSSYWARARQALADFGADIVGFELADDAKNPAIVVLSAASFCLRMDLLRELDRGIRQGVYPEDTCYYLVAEARQLSSSMTSALAELAVLCPDTEYHLEPKDGLLVVDHNDGLGSRSYSLDTLANCEEGMVSRIRFLFSARPFELYSCRCGQPAIIAIKQRGPRFMAEQLSEEQRANVVVWNPNADGDSQADDFSQSYDSSSEEPKRVYVQQCLDHVAVLDRRMLDSTGITVERLHKMQLRDLDRVFSRLRVFMDSKSSLVAFVGPDAGSLSLEGRLVCGAGEASSVALPERFLCYAKNANVLIVCEEAFCDNEALDSFTGRLNSFIPNTLDIGEELNYYCVHKKHAGLGRFAILSKEYI